jgi:Flp pilus assembly protein TadD
MVGAGHRGKYFAAALLSTVALVTASVARAQSIRAQASTPDIPARMPDAVVVAPFDNAPVPYLNLDWMRVGLPAALTDKLDSNPGLVTLRGTFGVADGAPIATPNDAAQIGAYGAKRRAAWVVTGRFGRTDWKLDLTVKLWKVEASGLATEMASWQRIDDFGQTQVMLGAAARALFEKVGKPWPADRLPALQRTATSDFYAFTLAGRGMRLLHGLGGAADLTRAEKDLGKAVFIDPKYAEAHYALSVLYAKKKLPAKARGRLTYALDLLPGYYPAVAALAVDAAREKHRGEAIDLAARALAIRPWDVPLRLLLGEQLWEDGDVDGAQLELSRIIKHDPDHLPARRLLVLVHATRGDGEELARSLEVVVRLDPKDQASRLDLGAAYWSLGRDGDALVVYESIVSDDPRQLQALKFIGDIHKKRGNTAEAIAWYERALKANKNDPRPYFLLGAAYAEAGEHKKAIRIFMAALKFPRYVADAEANLGAIYLDLGDDAQALWYTRAAARKRPASPRVQYNFGLALTRKKMYEDALVVLTRASELDPRDADTHFARGVVLLRLGKVEDAEAEFKAALLLQPGHADAEHNLRLIEDLRRRASEGEVVQPN